MQEQSAQEGTCTQHICFLLVIFLFRQISEANTKPFVTLISHLYLRSLSRFDVRWSMRTDLKKMATPRATRVVLESEHPYAHNADRKETVRIEGAKKLIVCFDDRSR